MPIDYPPIFTTYPNPHIKDFLATPSPLSGEVRDYHREPFVEDVAEGKNTPIYNAHSYHTKVPPKGIQRFIEHYTDPGDVVLDPFCGSGMTGVAAVLSGRRVVLSDLSPAATHIAFGYLGPVALEALKRAYQQISQNVQEEIDWLYRTRCRRCHGPAAINYTIWSDCFACPNCSQEFSLWNVAIERDSGQVRDQFPCPGCALPLQKRSLRRLSTVPVRVNYTCPTCGRQEENVEDDDLSHLTEIKGREIQYWYPNQPMMFKGERWGDTWRAGIHDSVTHVYQFYTHRNLWALARLWHEIGQIADPLVQAKLRFAFTAISRACSRMFRYAPHQKHTAGMSGTLYIPSISYEYDVRAPFGRRMAILQQALVGITTTDGIVISIQSATDLSNIPKESVDYVFTDPPFGSNLMYSELNFLWEAWLGVFTDNREEATVNQGQGKDIGEYEKLMARSFAQLYRVLKPNRWMTVVFHNSDTRIWQAITQAIEKAGFDVVSQSYFDKKQRSFKQTTSEGAVGLDVIINALKPRIKATRIGSNGKPIADANAALAFLKDYLASLPLTPDVARSTQALHSRFRAHATQDGMTHAIDFDEFRRVLAANFKPVGDYWYLWGQEPASRQNNLLYIEIHTELDAIRWLSVRLREQPAAYGKLQPQFLGALKTTHLERSLAELLETYFVQEDERWRTPQPAEREELWHKAFRRWAESKGPQPILTEILEQGFQELDQAGRYPEIRRLAARLPAGLFEESRKLFLIRRKAEREAEKRVSGRRNLL